MGKLCKKGVLLCLLFLATGCFRSCTRPSRSDMTAEQVVEAYLNAAFSMKSPEDKNHLLAYSTGDLESAIAGATEETIRKAYLDRRYTLQSYSTIGRRDRTPHEAEVTFRLVYKELPESSTNDKDAVLLTTENTVALEKASDGWRIREVIGAKSTFDFPLSPESRVTGAP
jgi:hypothetical protein